jgi:hypothetical protein
MSNSFVSVINSGEPPPFNSTARAERRHLVPLGEILQPPTCPLGIWSTRCLTRLVRLVSGLRPLKGSGILRQIAAATNLIGVLAAVLRGASHHDYQKSVYTFIMKHVNISSVFAAPFEEVRRLVLRPQTMVIISRPVVNFLPIAPARFPGQWADGQTYRVRILIFGFIPGGWYEIRIRLIKDDKDTFIGVDEGRGLLAPTWKHTVTLKRRNMETIYTDEVAIEAGRLTPFVRLFAKVIYRRRQRRWKKIVLGR